MNNNNKNNSTTKQAVLDLAKICAARGDLENSAVLSEIVVSLSDDVFSGADDVFNSHAYPDKTQVFAKINITKEKSVPIDALDPDQIYFLVWLIRRVSTYSNFVAFKISQLVEQGIGGSRPWGETKTKDVVSSLKKCGALLPVDSSQSRTFGTVYMISPYIFDAFGASSGSNTGKKFYNNFITENFVDVPTAENLPFEYPVVSTLIPGYPCRVRFTYLVPREVEIS